MTVAYWGMIEMTIRINPGTYLRWMIAVLFLLIVGHFLVILVPQFAAVNSISRFFHMNQEQNLPTFVSVMNMLLCAALLFLIAWLSSKDDRKEVRYWWVLALIFVFLALDEFTFIHESVSNITRKTLNTEGYLFFAWVIPYGILVLVFGAFYARFLMIIPGQTSRRFIFAGVLFLMGAVGMEMISSNYAFTGGMKGIVYDLYNVCEESLEILGIILFVKALLEYLNMQWPSFSIHFSSQD